MQRIVGFLLLVLFSMMPYHVKAETKKINVICDEWPPYQVVINGEIRGLNTKIVETVFSRMDIEVENIKAYPWKRAITMIEKGRADALFSANFTEARAEFAYYPEETLIKSPWVMWVRSEDDLAFESYDDLKGKKVGLVRGYSYTPDLWSFVKEHNLYEEAASDEQNFRKLNAGRIEFVLAELGNGFHIMKELGLDNIIPLKNNPVKTDGLYIIFHKEKVTKAFVDNFSNELKKLKQESLYKYLYNEYFSD